MSATLHAFNTQIAGIVKCSVVLGLDKSEFVQNRITVARPIHQKLCTRIKSDQEILVAIVAGLNKVGQSVAGAVHLVAAHRPGYIKNYAHRNRRIVIAEEGNLLLLFFVEDRERLF